jgi:lysyl-tRNA synthetase class 2
MRAEMLARIRAFFAARAVLEVETPVLAHHAVTDPQLHSLQTRRTGPGAAHGELLYLHTSPEFAMKRLLCAGAGSIYQIARVFRDGESGRMHNPEFTLIEWYRLDFDHHRLMEETAALVCELLALPFAYDKQSYGALFRQYLGIDPHRAQTAQLAECAAHHGLDLAGFDISGAELTRDAWLDFLLSHLIQPKLGSERPLCIYDYPVSQAALARLRWEEESAAMVGERFELYFRGIELANGYHELGDANEQRARFERDNALRREAGEMEIAPDERLLVALAYGLPACAGVALGFDRLVMLAAGLTDIAEAMAFTTDRA